MMYAWDNAKGCGREYEGMLQSVWDRMCISQLLFYHLFSRYSASLKIKAFRIPLRLVIMKDRLDLVCIAERGAYIRSALQSWLIPRPKTGSAANTIMRNLRCY